MEKMKRPSARAGAGTKKAPKLRLVPGGKARSSRRLVSCEDGFCGAPRETVAPTPDETNIMWAKLAAAVALELDFEIPGLGEARS